MPGKNFDVIVIGTGAMGAATCYQLAQKGHNVLGLEQFSIPHENGSHGGQSRIIRKAYFEHPDYVPLLEKAYANWKQLEQLTGEQVYFKTGILYTGAPNHSIIAGVKRASLLHDIDIEEISSSTISQRFPAFTIPTGDVGLFEPDAGFLLPAKAIELFVEEARKKGAVIHTREKLLEWKKENSCIKVITDKNIYQASKLIITAGAWAGKLMPQPQVPLRITKQVVIWVKPQEPQRYSPETFPCWMIAAENLPGLYYGFPYLDENKFGQPSGLKFALHFPGEETGPDQVNRTVSKEEINHITKELVKYFPAAAAEIAAASTCLYANSPDENFIIDYLPAYDKRIVIACGFSGHGFKFASVIGEVLADMAIDGKTSLPVEFLNASRFNK